MLPLENRDLLVLGPLNVGTWHLGCQGSDSLRVPRLSLYPSSYLCTLLLLEICPRGNNKSSYYYIFVFMINFYIHAISVLTRNINTCVICKLVRVPSKASL